MKLDLRGVEYKMKKNEWNPYDNLQKKIIQLVRKLARYVDIRPEKESENVG